LSQHLEMEVLGWGVSLGGVRWSLVGPRCVVAGSAAGRSARASSGVLGGDWGWGVERRGRGAGGCLAGGGDAVVPGGWWGTPSCFRRTLAGTCPSASVKRSRSATPMGSGSVRSPATWGARHRRSHGSSVGTRQPVVAGWSTGRRWPSGIAIAGQLGQGVQARRERPAPGLCAGPAGRSDLDAGRRSRYGTGGTIHWSSAWPPPVHRHCARQRVVGPRDPVVAPDHTTVTMSFGQVRHAGEQARAGGSRLARRG